MSGHFLGCRLLFPNVSWIMLRPGWRLTDQIAERASPSKEPKPRPERNKPLPEHLKREVVTHTPQGDCCRVAVASCGTSVTMSVNNWSMFLRASRSSAMCDRSSPARTAIEWSKRRHRRVRSSAAWPDQASWPM
ncbi:hypothetical protein SBA5_880045 [Candidatus Sulfotelmatomonas gaucii]|uniref:Uncharacterized protein n=1 Tax=Candidatus Sulfuritelmatomonas gaucii TaxID=2043161 RepID=A0A2N9M7I1_9BACT|nr:hypothetical protein SBA5_880045 [Candidatus Sulfotelmatomonas gaucii]